MEIRHLVLVDGVRTPMAEFLGPFSEVSANDLGAHAARALFERSGIDPAVIDHTVVGNALQTSGDAIYGARHVALKAGVPKEVPALTVNRLCGSGIQAILSGAHLILTGEATTCLVGGMENMSQAPFVARGARKGMRLGHTKFEDLMMESLFDGVCGYYMAQTSNNLARDYGITREEQDAFAARSQARALGRKRPLIRQPCICMVWKLNRLSVCSGRPWTTPTTSGSGWLSRVTPVSRTRASGHQTLLGSFSMRM